MSQRWNRITLAKLLLASAATWIATSAAASGAVVDPSLFQDLHWRSIGPFRGGRVLAVAGAPDDPRRFYFGAVNGGVWKTEDAGRTWSPIFDAEQVGSIGALAVAPSAPKVIYVGTGEADMRSDIAQGVGMFKSADGGASWTSIGLKDTQQIGKILVDPRNPDVLLVAALGHPYGPNSERGVFRSTDGGRTWTRTLYRDPDTGAIDMAYKPGDPDVVYASLWRTRRPPWNVYPPSSGPGGGLYKSVDGGRTWTALAGHGLPSAPGRIGVATTPARPDRVFALVDDPKEGGLYRSDDAGASWAKVSGDKRIWQRGWYFGGITADPRDADRVWVCDTIILRSDDGGAHFIPIKGDPTGDDFHSLWIDAANPDRRILGVDQGALVTINGGATWSSWFNQPTGQFYHVATDNRFPYRVYGAQQDSGAAGVPSRTDNADDGINMTNFHEITAGGESDEIAPDPDDPDTVYGGRVDKLDLRSGQTRSVDPTLAFPENYRGTWTLPLVFGKRDHDLYFGNQRIFRTADGGRTWVPISPDLSRPTLTVPHNLDATTAKDSAEPGPRRGVVYDIATSPVKDALIWAGTDDGLVWRTRDGGAHWDDVTPAVLQPWSKIGAVEPSHFDPGVAYIAVDRHRLDDPAPYIYRTRDGGRTWAPIMTGLPNDGSPNSVNVVREDPVQRGLLYAGTERGAFVSFDDGERWQPLQRDLPPSSVRDITFHGDDLVIATHGRGFYILDDIVPLRGLAASDSPGLRLFAPAPAIRLHEPDFIGTPMPKDEAMAPNPPVGAYIDYILPAGSQSPVQISIYDARGGLVDRFASTDPVRPLDLGKIDAAPEWLGVSRAPASGPGQHRFVWNLRYAAPAEAAADETQPAPQGVWAPPGRYAVELKVQGQSLRRAFEVLPDPRVKLDQAAFQAEFDLARQVEQARIQANEALAQAAGLRTQLQAQLTRATPGRQAEIARLDHEIDEVADLPPDDPANSMGTPPRSSTGLYDIAQRLDKLTLAVDGADGAPTPDMLAGFRQAKAASTPVLARWAQIEQEWSAQVPILHPAAPPD